MFSNIVRHKILGLGSRGIVAARDDRILFIVFIIAAALRVVLALRPGLWGDEIFSLAMATGHSLEHAAAEAAPHLGDYIETRAPLPPAEWRRYLEHESPAAGAGRVVRAVFMSDSNPPLYYLLLAGWTRLFGTGDAALRLFSAAFAIAALPLLWLTGQATIGRRGATFACLLYAFAPLSVFYAHEGRMYALTLFLGLLLAWSTLRLDSRGGRPWLAAWALTGAAALLTHYFLSFVWFACLVWLLTGGDRRRAGRAALAASASLLLAAPWYLRIPESLSRWRITAGWLDEPVTLQRLAKAAPFLGWEMFAPSGLWGGSREVNVAVAAALGLLLLLFLRSGAVRELLERERLLPLLWFAASIGGLLLFDVLQGTRTSRYVRYALPGLPAAMLLGGAVLSRISPKASLPLLGAILLVWSIGLTQMLTRPARWHHPFPEMASRLDQRMGPEDLIIVHSIPSGVIGVARYYDGDTPIASWVEPLGLRNAEEDMPLLLAHVRCTVAVAKIHFFGPSPAEAWLERHARPLRADTIGTTTAEIRYYRPPSAPPDCDDPALASRWEERSSPRPL